MGGGGTKVVCLIWPSIDYFLLAFEEELRMNGKAVLILVNVFIERLLI